MNKLRLTTTAAGIALAALAAMPGAASAAARQAVPASASRLPKVQARNEGWSHMSRRPGRIDTVAPYADPEVSQIRWSNWKSQSAYGRGWPATSCPTGTLPIRAQRVGILLWRVRRHDGTRFFTRMTLSCADGAPGQPPQLVKWAFLNRAQFGWHQTSPA